MKKFPDKPESDSTTDEFVYDYQSNQLALILTKDEVSRDESLKKIKNLVAHASDAQLRALANSDKVIRDLSKNPEERFDELKRSRERLRKALITKIEE